MSEQQLSFLLYLPEFHILLFPVFRILTMCEKGLCVMLKACLIELKNDTQLALSTNLLNCYVLHTMCSP